jgi:hypothetical protein
MSHLLDLVARAKKSAQPLDAVGALRSAFCAMRREGKPAQNG